MKQWPENDEPANLDDLKNEVVAALQFAYKFKRRNRDRNIPIAGPDVPSSIVCRPGYSHLLTSRELRYESERGRNALMAIAEFAILLGIEQGRRMTMTGDVVGLLKDKIKAFERDFELGFLKVNKGRKSRRR